VGRTVSAAARALSAAAGLGVAGAPGGGIIVWQAAASAATAASDAWRAARRGPPFLVARDPAAVPKHVVMRITPCPP
jgi:hypothetical protein